VNKEECPNCKDKEDCCLPNCCAGLEAEECFCDCHNPI